MMPTDHQDARPPRPITEPGLAPIDIPVTHWHDRSFVSGDPTGDRLRVRYYLRQADDTIVANAWFGPGAAGPPGHAHGGSIAALLDEIMGMGAWILGHRVLAASLTTRFLKSLPLDTEARAEGWVHKVRGRKVMMKSRLLDPANGAVFAESEGLFLKLDQDQLDAFAKLSTGPLDRPPDRGPGSETTE